jgi:lipopolysaccharide transport system permease protein
LVMLAVLSFLFTRVLPLSIPNYGAFVLVGILAWTWFSGAVTSATVSVSDSPDLVRRPGFTVSLLPVVAISSHLIQMALALPVLALAVVLSTGRLPLTATALPVVVLVHGGLMLGPAWVLAALNVRFRDVSHLVGVLLFPLFYITPVFYDAGAVPEGARWAYRLNPLVHLVEAYRDSVLLGRWPSAAALAGVALVGLGGAWAGYRIFESMAATFPDDL